MGEFGVVYKCFKEQRAVEHSLDMLYSIYPDCPVYLMSDGGLDFSHLEDKHSNLKFYMGNDNRGWMLSSGGCNDAIDLWQTPEIHEKFYETLMIILERVNAAVQFCNKPHMLFMEPDVLVRGRLTIPNEHLLGVVPQPNIAPDAGWNSVLRGIKGAKEVVGWSWPIIFSKDAFDRAYDFAKKNEKIVRDLLMSDVRVGIADDVWLPVLFGAVGVIQVNNPEATECRRNPGWRASGHPLLHEYREMYPAKGSNNVGRHYT